MMIFRLFIAWAMFSFVSHAHAYECGNTPLPHEDAFIVSVIPLNDQSAQVNIAIAPCYYLYQERVAFSATPATLKKVALSQGIEKDDPHFGKVRVLRDRVSAVISFEPRKPNTALTLSVDYQGCAEKIGLCYPKSQQTLTFEMPAANHAGQEIFAKRKKIKSLFLSN